MSTSRLIRTGGLAVFLGATLWALQRVSWTLLIGDQDPANYPQPDATLLWLLGFAVSVLILMGLPALYAHHAEKAGGFGLAAFVVVFAGMALVAGNAFFGVFIQPGLVDLIGAAEGAGVTVEEPVMAIVSFLVTLLLQVVGWLLFGLSALRARVLSRGAAVLVMIGTPVWLVMNQVLGFSWWQLPLFEAGLAWMGISLWRGRTEPAQAGIAAAA